MQHNSAFSDKQYNDAYPQGIEHHWWNIARNAMVADLIRMAERRQASPLSVLLEIGCGRGFVVEYFRDTGRDCYGVELSPVSIDERLRSCLWTGQDCLTLPHSFRNKVELILLLDVIEHIEDPATFIKQIRDAYPSCRWLIISVPARMELWSDFDEQYGHFRRYDIVRLRNELSKAGAKMIRAQYRFKILYPLLYFLVRWGSGRPSTNSTPVLKLLHKLFGQLVNKETWVIPDIIYGTSILGLAEFPERVGNISTLEILPQKI